MKSYYDRSMIYIPNISQMGCTRHLSKNTSKVRCSNASLNLVGPPCGFFSFHKMIQHIQSSYCKIRLYVHKSCIHPVKLFTSLGISINIKPYCPYQLILGVIHQSGEHSTVIPRVSPTSLVRHHTREASNVWRMASTDFTSWFHTTLIHHKHCSASQLVDN